MIVRQFISWIRTAPAGERAEATRALARAWLISDLSEDDRAAAEGALLMLLDDPSPLVRQAMAEVFSRSSEAPAAHRAGAVARPAVGRAAGARTFAAADRCRSRRHRRDRQQRHAMRHRPPHQSAALGLRCDCRSRLGRRGARTDRKRLCRTGAVLLGPHRRTSRPSRRDPGIDAGAGRPAGRHARGAGRQTVRDAGAIRRRPQLAERRPGRAARERSARAFDRQHRGAFARRGHAGPGAASARHRPAHRRA